MQASPAMSLCPSFSAHSSATLADIASRVIDEFRNEPHPHPDWIDLDPQHPMAMPPNGIGSDEEFEFAFEPNCSPISADQIFHNGRIKANFNPRPKTGRMSLRRLMMEDRDAPPKQAHAGGGKRWKLRDLVHWSDVKTTREGDARRSFQGQKQQDMMGILANVNGLTRKLRPF